MKKALLYTILTGSIIAGLSSCKKDIVDRTTTYTALNPKNEDLNADTWKPVLVTNTSNLNVPAPDAVSSSAYQAELKEVKDMQAHITEDQKAIIKYWSAGSVLRWNQIMRELVAKHNIPPYQLEDGTYPAPNSANPFAYPQFPFSNPPYAARAYAYVSAAQYDALIAAWHFKKMYNRPAPYKNDQTIKALIPASDLPSYPSEDAVVEGVTVELMKLLFPTEIDYVTKKAAEERTYRMLAGANVRSDLDAGELLGKQVAASFTARAKSDRAGKAGGSAVIWKQFETTTAARNEQYWVSLEFPKRPPMLPLFNKVTPFLFDSAAVVSLRPKAPYSTNSPEFKKETEEVLYYATHATREHQAQVAFWADGVATNTPAGHWNSIAADEFVKENYSEIRWARNLALLNMAEMDAAIVCWDAKFYYFNPRPSQMNLDIKTLTGVPNFPAYTSGHSNFSAAAAKVLSYLLPDRGNKFNDLANQASMSRLYGGIHYRSDVTMGMVTGGQVGDYAVARGKSDGADSH